MNPCPNDVYKKVNIKYSHKQQGFYKTPAWRRIRLLALHRDNYLCQMCVKNKQIKKATEVHHVKPIDDHPQLALELSNLMSLCWDCHETTKPRGAIVYLPVRVIHICDVGGDSDKNEIESRD